MSKKYLLRFVCVLFISGLALPACSPVAPETPTATPEPTTTNTPLPSPTKTSRPTFTPRPTITPDVAATQRADEFNALLQDFKEKGYVEPVEGETIELEDFEEEWAQLDWYQWWIYEKVISDFVLKAHFKWSSAHETPEASGCGFVFGIQENRNHYVVFLDKASILFRMKRGTYNYTVGKTRGPGRTNFGNPAEADFALAVKGQSAYVSVDGEVTEYTLSVDQTTTGKFGPTILSGTNRDYGTRCEMTDVTMWLPK